MIRNLVAFLLVCALHSVARAMPQDQTATAQDTPRIIRYETIPLAEDVHTTIVGESTATDGHRGCFRDNEDRDLPHQAYEAATNTIEQCRDVCQRFGFRFAGVQVRFCFCGNSFGRYGRADNCNAKCPGNNKQMCGGGLSSNVYVVPGYPEPVPVGPFDHYGCYRDSRIRDLPHPAYDAASSNTIEECRAACQRLGFKYAAVQYTSQCFCGNSFGRYGRAENCNAKCPGNNKQTCGGVWASNIFGVSGYVEPKPEGELEYFGCFRDGALRDLPHLAYVGSNNIEKCKSACKTLGFRFAAVQYGNQCLCGNSFGRYGKANNCNMKCSGSNKQICGGDRASGVFSAAFVKLKQSKHQLLGCYKDRRVRDLPHLAYAGSNSIEKCVSACKKLKMKFAAVQYSFQCSCGDTYGTYGVAGNCNMRCNGNREQICGGAWANNVYNTLP